MRVSLVVWSCLSKKKDKKTHESVARGFSLCVHMDSRFICLKVS